jgi:hypothetical protein
LILLDTSDSRLRAVWETAIDLSRRQPKGWTIIGAQMVALHAIEHRRRPPRQSLDLDLLVNVRVLHDGTGQISRFNGGFGHALEPDARGAGS